jgi:hypothetical protein
MKSLRQALPSSMSHVTTNGAGLNNETKKKKKKKKNEKRKK